MSKQGKVHVPVTQDEPDQEEFRADDSGPSSQDLIVHNTGLTTSGKIRRLDAMGLTRGQIAKVLNKRYQHVRNVLITPVKKQS
jgi:hypothetical protein